MRLSSLAEDLLTLLQGRELYGLAMLKAFAAAGGEWSPPPKVGSLYPMLHTLETHQLVRSWWVEGLRYYTTTRQGDAALHALWTRRRRLAQYGEGLTRQGALAQVRQIL